jgi:hypothetical protein
MIEYKVLGKGTVEVNGSQVSLDYEVQHGNVASIEGALNALGKDGWELLDLEPPFVFIRRS